MQFLLELHFMKIVHLKLYLPRQVTCKLVIVLSMLLMLCCAMPDGGGGLLFL